MVGHLILVTKCSHVLPEFVGKSNRTRKVRLPNQLTEMTEYASRGTDSYRLVTLRQTSAGRKVELPLQRFYDRAVVASGGGTTETLSRA